MFQGLAMVMHKNVEGPAVFEMLNGALEVARQEKRVNEERNIKILVAQMYVVKVMSWSTPAKSDFFSVTFICYIKSSYSTLMRGHVNHDILPL